MNYSSYRALLCATGLLLLSACATSTDRAFELDNTLRAYENAIRWSDFERAKAFYKSDAPTVFGVKGVRVTGYDVTRQDASEDGLLIKQTVEIRYYRHDDVRVRKVVDEQEWDYDREHGRWRLKSPAPQLE